MLNLIQKLRDPLYKNSIFLMLSSITNAGTGFVFWVVAARFYSAEDVGLASVIVSAMFLVSMLSLLGLDISLIRFLPEKTNKAELINSCLTVSFIFSISFSSIFIAGLNIWVPSLTILKENIFLFLLFIIFTTTLTLTGLLSHGVFVGFRKTEYSFMQAMVSFARIGIVPFLVSFGAIGIYVSYGLTSIIAFLFGVILTSRFFSYNIYPTLKKDIIKDIFYFSFGNYLARIFEMLPIYALPIMVTNVLGAEENAYFFIAWQISILLLMIPRFTSISLLAEGSYKIDELDIIVRRVAKFIFLLLGIAVMSIYAFGKYLLWIFGKEYAEKSLKLLLILVIGSFPFAFNVLYASVHRVQKNIKLVIYVYACIAITTLIVSYLLMLVMGTVGAGVAWIVGNVITALVICINNLKKKR